MLRFIPMGVIEEFEHETNPIYKCPGCRWVFSPALTATEAAAMVASTLRTQKNEQGS